MFTDPSCPLKELVVECLRLLLLSGSWLLLGGLGLGYVGIALLSRSLDNRLFHRITMTFPGLIARTVNIRQGPELLVPEWGGGLSGELFCAFCVHPQKPLGALVNHDLNEGHNQELRWAKALITPHRLAGAGWTTGWGSRHSAIQLGLPLNDCHQHPTWVSRPWKSKI